MKSSDIMADADVALIPPPIRSFVNEMVGEWYNKFESKTLKSDDFHRYWVKNVRMIYNPKGENCYDEQILFTPLEQFLCGSEETAQTFEKLRILNDVPSLCGKVFKSGEPTYTCKECGLDATCVLCVDCFTNSEHRNHKYKMSASGGGGYCDCGDEEAWKFYSYCSNHHGKSQSDDVSPLDKLPIDVVDRFRVLLRIILNYCHNMLTWEHCINLPPDLQFSLNDSSDGQADTYCTILFNDETHTYEQVIDTLTKAINCGKKIAMDFATTIDREGRSIVKCSTFSECNSVRHYIERVTSRLASKLKVLVMHTEIIAHQTFALKLLSWLQTRILSLNKGFCYVFTNSIMEDNLLESIMLVDTQLWKTARNQWHQLFISGMLMEASCKKTFAKCFISVYPTLMKEFIADDHDHTISITSLSVQIFTVPTLAHTLIQDENALAVVLRAFLSECERRHMNSDGKLHFQRNVSHSNFRRAQYMLYDLGYLVTIAPTSWNDALKRNFCHGMQSFYTLLGMMQDMDPVVRQVGQHLEYEAEWESGVNLQLRLTPVITMLLKLCCDDFVVYLKCLRANIKHFRTSQPKMEFIGVELADHAATCIKYDVASEAVSIHLPLVRFMAGLLLHIDKFGLTYDQSEFSLFDNIERPSSVQLMELPLRTVVMLAQFRAGMWRRNGYSLLNQVYFYHNVRLRDEMFDRDVLMLQIAASMIESNEFVIHLIYKYGLLNWAAESFDGPNRRTEDDNIRQVITVAEEFLSLLLTILSERFVPGLGKVTESERAKKEIIQLLCIEPMPHSLLFRSLPKDPSDEIGLESVLNEVANFKVPQGPGIGKYELKAEYLKWFNPFYFHYSREEQSKAEEAQIKRKKQLCEEVCCPPPVPPEFTPRFAIIVNMLQCDVMLHVMELILKRTPNLHSTAFSETQLEKVLHLIGVALYEEERVIKVDRDSSSFFCFTAKANKKNFPHLLEECSKCPRVDVCGEPLKDLISWVINKFKYVENLHKLNDEQMQDSDVTAATATASKDSANDRKRKTEMAAARRTRIMAQMSAMQKSFIKVHADMFKETVAEDTNLLSKSNILNMYSEEFEDPTCFVKDPRRQSLPPKLYTCILCREDQELTCSGRTLVLSAYVQKSSILSKNRKHQMGDLVGYDPLLLHADLFWSVHTSTCGHVMHSDCWQKFFESVVHKEQRRPVRFGRHTSFDVDRKEFLCPLCERLSNSAIPLIPPLSSLIPPDSFAKTVDISVDDWLRAMKKACEAFLEKAAAEDEASEDCKDLSKFSPFHYKALPLDFVSKDVSEDAREKFKALFQAFEVETDEEPGPPFSASLLEMMKLFAGTTYTIGLNKDTMEDDRGPSLSWSSSTYTLHAIEWMLRGRKKALFGAHSARNALCLEGLIRFCGASLKVFDHNVVRTHCVRLLRYLLVGDHYLSSPQCCLDLDAFSLLAFLVLSMPVLFEHIRPAIVFPLGGTLDKHLLHLVLVFHFVQVLLTYPFQEEEEKMETDHHPIIESTRPHGESVTALLFYEEVRTAAGFDRCYPAPSGHTIVHSLKAGSLPFLRTAAIFFHTLTDTPPPSALQEVRDREFDSLCTYFGFPTTLDELLASTSLKHLALSWARHPRTLHLLMNGEAESLVRHPLSINRLVSLPPDYSELINSVSQFTCPNSEDSRNPTMCLVCGELLCSQSYCCQIDLGGTLVGACTHHAFHCGSGVGVFLRIRDCKILLLSDKNKGCFTAPPYIDDYGETDQGLYRGNPLHLCQERYEELQDLWLSHNIPERVSHNMEQSTSVPNWQLL